MLKRILSSICFLALLNAAHSQNELPVFVDFNFSPESVQNGQSIVVRISAYDSIHGIDGIGISIFDPLDDFIDQILINGSNYVGNNTYKKAYTFSQWSISGSYTLSDLVIISNSGEIYRHEEDLATVNVISSTPDSTGPVLNFVETPVGILQPEDRVEFTFTAIEEVSGLYVLWYDLYDPRNELADIEVYYFDGTEMTDLGENKYRISRSLPGNVIRGNYYINIEAYDHAGNYSNSINSEAFFINGEYEDITAPIIYGVNVYPDSVDLLDTLYLEVITEDDESGLDKISIDLIDEQDNSRHYFYSFDDPAISFTSPNIYLFPLRIPGHLEQGDRHISLYIRDMKDNSIQYIDTTTIYITGEIDSSQLATVNYEEIFNPYFIYPNPVDSHLTIETRINSDAKTMAAIYDLQGKLLYKNDFIWKQTIDLSGFHSGAYFVVLQNDNLNISRLLIKK